MTWRQFIAIHCQRLGFFPSINHECIAFARPSIKNTKFDIVLTCEGRRHGCPLSAADGLTWSSWKTWSRWWRPGDRRTISSVLARYYHHGAPERRLGTAYIGGLRVAVCQDLLDHLLHVLGAELGREDSLGGGIQKALLSLPGTIVSK